MRLLLSTIAAAALLFTAIAQPMVASVISTNFVGGQAGNGTGGGSAAVTGTAGVIQVGNWNNAVPAAGSIVSAIDDSGAATGATVSWSVGNTWAATGTAPGGGSDADMMSGYLDNFDTNSITVTGLPATFTSNGYDVYVYFNVDQVAQMGFTATDNLANTDTRFGRQSGGAGTNYPLGGPNGYIVSTDTVNSFATATPSNAILLQGLTGSTVTITGVAGSGAPGSGNRSRPNGFQIVALEPAVPEPSSIVLWLMSGAALATFCRRRRR